LSHVAPGVLWVALLLAALLSMARIFEIDHEDGALEVLATGHLPLELVALAKSFAHWLTVGVPLALLAPILGILLQLELRASSVLVLTMLAGTPAISFLGAVGGALTLGTRRGGLLLALLVLPLYVPTLVFGIDAAGKAFSGSPDAGAPFLMLIATSLAAVVLAPIAAAAALRAHMQ
jgi:heme exporter protein B